MKSTIQNVTSRYTKFENILPDDLSHTQITEELEEAKNKILDAAETALGFFGFDRTAYSNIKNGTRKKWYEELREQRTRDIETEMI
jgi:hypothetical protein